VRDPARWPLARFVLPFSVFEGLMPGRPSRGLRTRVGRLPVWGSAPSV